MDNTTVSAQATSAPDELSTPENVPSTSHEPLDTAYTANSAQIATDTDRVNGDGTRAAATVAGPGSPPAVSLKPSSSASSSGAVGAPAPKKFSALNINKRFLEKNASSSSSSHGHTPAQPQPPKSTGSAAKPSPPLAASHTHSRLVTAKLTASPQPPSAAGPGWSRPSSATPPVAVSPTPSSSASNPPVNPTPTPHNHGPPQLPHAGKVIQPQPRPSVSAGKEQVNGISKPVWGNLKSSAPTRADAKVQNDFPTAAEVAQSLSSRPVDKKPPTSETASTKGAAFEADTFRGVHLDPNAHHWDEMEEGDDDFLGRVIEFGDGRQYQVEPTTSSRRSSPPRPPCDVPDEQESIVTHDISVSKEDRFQDDFDRSWPRSRPSPPNNRMGPSSSTSGTHSPPEHSHNSRVLFNERSNRLEPYSNSHSRADNRIGREPPPHHNVQLLHKHGSDRPRNNISPIEQREQTHRDFRRESAASSPSDERPWSRGRRPSFADSHVHEPTKDNTRQLPPHLATMPPQPASISLRQHSTREPWGTTSSRLTIPSREEVSFGSAKTQSPSSPSSLRSPTVSAHLTSPEVPTPASLPDVDVEEVRKAAMHSAAERARLRRQREEAEREKEKERARLKAAALEEKMKVFEQRKRGIEQKDNDTTVQVESTATVSALPNSNDYSSTPSSDRSIRPPLASNNSSSDRPLAMTRTTSSRGSFQLTSTPSDQVDSWRAKTTHIAPPVVAKPLSTQTVSSDSALQPMPVDPGADLLKVSSDESIEEVDFADMHTLVGASSNINAEAQDSSLDPVAQQATSLRRPPRPVASDFFDDEPARVAPASKGDLESSWRRKVRLTVQEPMPGDAGTDSQYAPTPENLSYATLSPSPHVQGMDIAKSPPASPIRAGVYPPDHTSFPLRTSRTTAYKEASLSTLDDTMSRIKGALDGLQQANAPTSGSPQSKHPVIDTKGTQPRPGRPSPLESARPAKWLPPALRANASNVSFVNLAKNADLRVGIEDFCSTGRDLPELPRQTWNSLVRLPKTRRYIAPLSKRQQDLLQRSLPRPRFDILSFDPPVDGMSFRDLSVNSVLFRQPPFVGGNAKHQIKLPSGVLKRRDVTVSQSEPAASPRVNFGLAPLPSRQSPGTAELASVSSNWGQKLEVIKEGASQSHPSITDLETVSCSPPPDVVRSYATEPSNGDLDSPTRSRMQPRLPAGASVGFYRNSTESAEVTSVRFIVSSELEDVPASQDADTKSVNSPSIASDDSQSRAVSIATTHAVNAVATALEVKKDEGNSDDSSDQMTLTPASSWTKGFKESPARAPDPEHLKMLWQQPSGKLEQPVVNSLEGIADDMPAVTFSLQEVKSEDGETPPPTMSSASSGPMRMSLHDVTRAFQQVPPSQAPSTIHKPTPQQPSSSLSPAVSHAAPNRQAGYPPPPPSLISMRPTYPTFASPMMSHAPTPVMYQQVLAPSPAPGPQQHVMVNGPQPQYGQPIWVPVPGLQTPGGPVRGSVPSPYPQHGFVSYPTQGMYAASPSTTPHGMPGQQPAGVQGKPTPNGPNRTVHLNHQPAMMSPALSHAHPHAAPGIPIYHGSPVMVHAHPVMNPNYPPHGHPPGPVGRSDGRASYGMPMMHPPHPHQAPIPGPYNTSHAQPFVRPPTW